MNQDPVKERVRESCLRSDMSRTADRRPLRKRKRKSKPDYYAATCPPTTLPLPTNSSMTTETSRPPAPSPPRVINALSTTFPSTLERGAGVVVVAVQINSPEFLSNCASTRAGRRHAGWQRETAMAAAAGRQQRQQRAWGRWTEQRRPRPRALSGLLRR